MKHVVRISDGMGNQMFQYAFAYALMRKTKCEVLIDPLFWGTSLRNYSLDKFNISITRRLVSPQLDYILGAGPRNGRRFKDLYRQHLIKKHFNVVTEKKIMNYDSDVMIQDTDSFFDGFWQTPLYFDNYRDEIKREFRPCWKLSEKANGYLDTICDSKSSVAIHIRRTDYVRNVGNAAVNLDYYQKALDFLKERVEDFRLFVFSDDKEFVKNTFKLCKYTIVENVTDLDEFEIMKMCKHKIVANSTFSWWAAYLGSDDGLVISPKVGIWGDDFYPESWHKIDANT